MNHAIRKSLWVLTASWLVVTGCGDDDDNTPPGNTGGSAGSGGGSATQGGGSSTGGSGGGTSGSGGSNRGGSGGTGGTATGGGAGAPTEGGSGGQSGSLECKVLGQLCHEADTGSGPAHDCHDVGHVGDAAECKAVFAECVSVCVGGDEGGGGAGGGGGATAGGAGGAGPTESPYCVALGELCHPVAELSPALDACHDLGHVGDGPACEAGFLVCAAACLAARDGDSGSGGAGGMSGGGSGGVSTGGVAGAGGSGG